MPHDQAEAVAQFIDASIEKQIKQLIFISNCFYEENTVYDNFDFLFNFLRPPTSITAARDKSAAVAFGYVNNYVTSPYPGNLITLFEFVLKEFDALEYQEHTEYSTFI